MMIWVTSDNHYGHKRIIGYANRPFETVRIMDAEMIHRWNERVKPEDLVIHLGDFSLTSRKRMRDIRNRLNGTIILIGNASHDHNKYRMSKEGFIVADDKIIIEDMIFTHEPMEEVPYGKWNIHGHIHEAKTSGRRINVCVEQTDYYPVSLDYIKKMIK